MGILQTFNLYISENRKGPHYECRIYPDLKTMRNAAVSQSKRMNLDWKIWGESLGACFKTGGSRRRGLVLLSREYFGIGAISHELTHAAIYEASIEGHEGIARLQGWLMAQFFNSLA